MSELKATTAQEIVRNEKDCDYMDELLGGVKMPPTQVYLKSEADEVIAELKDKLQNVYSILKETREWLLESQKLHKRCADNAGKIIRHHKYKRCLAMARWCERERIDAANYRIPREKWEFYDKWHRRWFKIAEQFKEAK